MNSRESLLLAQMSYVLKFKDLVSGEGLGDLSLVNIARIQQTGSADMAQVQ